MNRFVIGDPKDCIGCNTCMAACSEVHKAFGLQSFPRLQVMRNDDVTVPILCRHCDDSPCATVCPVHANYTLLMTLFNLTKVSVSVVNFVVLLAHSAQLLNMVLHRLTHLPIMKDSPSLMQ